MIIYGIKYKEEIVYIGQTIRPLKKRISSYKHSIKNENNKSYITNHLRAYGIDNHEFFIIESDIETRELLNDREIFYIKYYNTIYPNGLNLTEGGSSPVFSEETKIKMSNSRKGKAPWNKGSKGIMNPPWNKGLKLSPQSEESNRKRARFGEDNHFFGKTHTDESRSKMSDSLMGRKVWNKVENRIVKLDKDNNIVNIYPNKETIIKEGFEINSLNRAIRKNITYKGFYFKVEK